nr:hypothetical protein GCM10020063_023240 [Dactylosporangium thailandense]
MLYGIASAEQSRQIMQNSHIQPYGIVDVYPHFASYSDAKPGRHNESVWPMIQGYWAEAAARAGDTARFASETLTLAGLANTSGGYYEINNFKSGVPDGGWQTGGHWGPLADQTWSATAYLRMVYSGLFGLQLTSTGLGFRPTLPAGWGDVRLSGLPVRGWGNLGLDVRNAATGNGTPVQLWQCNGSNAQQWTLGSGGSLRVLGKCLDVSNGGTADSTKVQLWDCNGSGAQVWTPRPDGSLRNPQSGKCLDDLNSSTDWGTQQQLFTCNGTGAQRWGLPG